MSLNTVVSVDVLARLSKQLRALFSVVVSDRELFQRASARHELKGVTILLPSI